MNISTDIKYFRFDNVGAPVMLGQWGDMINVLDKCLVEGFSSQAVTAINIVDGVGTATFDNSHDYSQFQVVQFSGTGISALQGEFKIVGIASKSISFLVNMPNQSVTGTITCRLPSLGWSKPFYADKKAVYRAKDQIANPYFLRVTNEIGDGYNALYAKFARVGILETCTGMDDLTGTQTPYTATEPTLNWSSVSGQGTNQVKNGWAKWYYAFGTNIQANPPTPYETQSTTDGVREWLVVGNKDSFYIFPRFTNQGINHGAYGFVATEVNSQPNAHLIAANHSSGAQFAIPFDTAITLDNRTLFSAKNTAGVWQYNGTNPLPTTAYQFASTVPSGMANNRLASSQGIVLAPIYAIDPDKYLNGQLPLIMYSPTDCSNLGNYSLHIHGDEVYITTKFRSASSTTAAPVGTLFLKVYEGPQI